MCRVDKWTLAVVLIVVAIVFPFRLWWDMNHPENWNAGSLDDPHVYLWGWVAGGLFIACVTTRIITCERKNRVRKVKLVTLYRRAERLIREKKWQEAESVLQQCERLVNEKYI